MSFNLQIWKEKTQALLPQVGRDLAHLKQQDTPLLLYGYLSGFALLPPALAAKSGDLMQVAVTIGGVFGGLGGSLLANKVQEWANQAAVLTESTLTEKVMAEIPQQPELRQELDQVLEALAVIPQTAQSLGETDRAWFVATLARELAELGALRADNARLVGPGLIIQGSRLQGGDRSVLASQAQVIITGDGNQVTLILGSDPAAEAATSADLRRSYLNRLFEQCSYLPLAGVDRAVAGKLETELNLSTIYTALLTIGSEEPGRRAVAAEPKRLSALAQLDRQPYLVLLGDPGSGKSTFVNFVIMCLAGEELEREEANLVRLTAPLPDDKGQDQAERQPWQHGALLPVRIILRDFAAQGLPPVGQPATAHHLWEFISADLQAAQLGEFLKPLEKILRQKGGLLLLDGLDEVPEAGQCREQLKQAVEDFKSAFPRCRLLVTSRTYAYQEQNWRLKGFRETVLAPFSQGQIRRFVDGWYRHMAYLQRFTSDTAHAQAERLKQAILGNARLSQLAERPLLLTLMASLHAWRSGSLPERREELYDQAVDLLLYWWERPKVRRGQPGRPAVAAEPGLVEWLEVDRERVRRFLNELAYDAHAGQSDLLGTADIAEDRLAGGLLRLSDKAGLNPLELRRYLSQRAGLLLPRGVEVYTFPHRTFQEYLAACHLTDYKYPGEIARLARTDPDRWREVLLLAGAKAARGSQSAIWSLARKLCWAEPPRAGAAPEQVWGAHLAGQALVETANLADVDEDDRQTLARIKAWLNYILAQAALPARERALAGQTLAVLGDDRPGQGLRADGLPDIAWCDIPAGPFVRGSVDDRLSFVGKETPQQTITLPTFRIGRYPITNIQYTVFVEDGGYTDKWRRCWTKAGWRWKEKRTGPDKFGGVFDLANHPVVMVSWYEAVAFCHWLTERLRAAGKLGEGKEVSLPSESQWEKAARGPNGRVYPWGNEADPERANYGETGIGATSVVGCFPGGASVYGVEEMSGNIWEWCRTKFEKSYENYRDDNALEGDAPRVVRGGAFFSYARLVRCAARSGSDPFYRSRDYGFRVCVVGVSPSS
ncbi:MAG: SUMF1/EgtB/PvdO family nonheme iron enzyme [Anaerolineae bacterium]|nr:SUMF1/EgtB/PvdO family nonheme iron enzyme [Anaerolineae bacterium]